MLVDEEISGIDSISMIILFADLEVSSICSIFSCCGCFEELAVIFFFFVGGALTPCDFEIFAGLDLLIAGGS